MFCYNSRPSVIFVQVLSVNDYVVGHTKKDDCTFILHDILPKLFSSPKKKNKKWRKKIKEIKQNDNRCFSVHFLLLMQPVCGKSYKNQQSIIGAVPRRNKTRKRL